MSKKPFKVYIMSRGRYTPDQMYTLNSLLVLRENGIPISVVVPHNEYDLYRRNVPVECEVIARPESADNLAKALEYVIYEQCPDSHNAVMIDDDLRFCVRKSPESASLRQCEPDDIVTLFTRLNNVFDDDNVIMAGVSARGGNNQKFPSTLSFCTRQMQLHAVDVAMFKKLSIHPAEVVCKSDFHMTLSVLENGYKNAVIDDFALDNARGSNSKGGVSSYRTLEVSNAAAHLLQDKHPGFVKIVEKNNQWKGMSGVQLDVQMAWKKAYAYGLTRR